MVRTRTDPPRHHHANVVVREEMHVYVTGRIVFFDLDDFRFRDERRPFRHIPADPDRETRAPRDRQRHTTHARDAGAHLIGVSSPIAVHRRRVDKAVGMVDEANSSVEGIHRALNSVVLRTARAPAQSAQRRQEDG